MRAVGVSVLLLYVAILYIANVTSATASSKSGPPSQLLEQKPFTNSGPSNAKGIIYYIRGFSGVPSRDGKGVSPYFIRSLQVQGWDVIDAKVPHAYVNPHFGRSIYPAYDAAVDASAFVRNRVKSLRAQGYRKIVIVGHSWGGWVAMFAAKINSDVDALILSSPATFGDGVRRHLNTTRFPDGLDDVKVPTILLVFSRDEYNLGELGKIAEKQFAKLNVPHLIIDQPAGFLGHFAGYLPIFDYVYGACIQPFLDSPSTQACRLPPLSNDDFRSILDIKQVHDVDERRIKSLTPLVGKAFTVYRLADLNGHYQFVSESELVSRGPGGQRRLQISFRDRMVCLGSTCRLIVAWSKEQFLEFDPRNGALKAWWVEEQ
jgi:predicted alpha/beta-hydrolase family hydrolase